MISETPSFRTFPPALLAQQDGVHEGPQLPHLLHVHRGPLGPSETLLARPALIIRIWEIRVRVVLLPSSVSGKLWQLVGSRREHQVWLQSHCVTLQPLKPKLHHWSRGARTPEKCSNTRATAPRAPHERCAAITERREARELNWAFPWIYSRLGREC